MATNLPKIIKPVEFLTNAQKDYYDIIGDEGNNIIMCHGMAGTGKTIISLQKAIEDVLVRNKM